MPTKPLVSICIKSWNGRPYIREALAAAFAQTYRPLEVAVVDDASDDGSWDEIRALCAARRDDPGVRVVAKRNDRNLGSLGNWEEVCSLAHGELLVKADGDDVSTPDRVEKIAAAWEADGRRALAICHSGWQMDRRGRRRGRLRQVTPGWPLGAAMAFSPRILEFFGRTADGSLVDDEVWTRRALMLGTVLTIPDRLVHYRLGSGETTNEWNIRAVVSHCTKLSLAAVRAAYGDAARLGKEDAAHWCARLESEEARLLEKASLVEGKTFRERYAAFRKLWPGLEFSIANYLRIAFLVPRPLSNLMLFAYVLARNFWRAVGRFDQTHRVCQRTVDGGL